MTFSRLGHLQRQHIAIYDYYIASALADEAVGCSLITALLHSWSNGKVWRTIS